MTDHELLLAISNIVQSHVEPLKEDMKDLKEDVRDLQKDVDILKSETKALQIDMRDQKLMMENKMLPRLQNIEACYTSTYRRYADGINDLETLQTDMGIVKKVVSEHSEKLQKIS